MLRRKFWVVFSTSSNFCFFPKQFMGPEASENVVVHPEAPGGHLGTCLGRAGVSGRTFWYLLGVRRASWEGLGRSWGDLGATFEGVRFRIVFLIDFDPKKVPKGRHFENQNEAKINPKTIENRSRFSRANKYP